MADVNDPSQPTDLEKLMQLQKDYEANKAQMGAYGQAADMLAQAPTRGAAMYGWAPTKTNFQKSLEDSVGSSPVDQESTGLKLQDDELKNNQMKNAADANSSVSKASRDLYQKMGTALDGTESASDLDRLQKLQEMYQSQKQQKLAHADTVASKSNDAYDKYVNAVEKQAETLRGDDAAKLASARLAAVASGRALINKYKGHEDDMTQDDMALLAADRVKAVTGGVPGQQEMEHMMPHNMGTKWAATKSFFTGSPSATNSGGWVKSADDDFGAADKSARSILENRQKQITSNPRLKREDAARIAKMAVPPIMDDSSSSDDHGGAAAWLADARNKNNPNYAAVKAKFEAATSGLAR